MNILELNPESRRDGSTVKNMAALPEDPGFVLGTQVRSVTSNPDTLFWPPQAYIH